MTIDISVSHHLLLLAAPYLVVELALLIFSSKFCVTCHRGL